MRIRHAPTHPRLPALPHDARSIAPPDRGPLGKIDPQTDSLTVIPDRATFDAFAVRDDVPGALGVRELKFVITDVGTDDMRLVFMNSNKHPLHYHFVTDVLGYDLSTAEFNRITYFTEDRQFLVGSVLAFDSYTRPDGSPGLYALEFWPTDPVSVAHVSRAYRLLRDGMPFAADLLAYHPSGDLQERLFAREAERFAQNAVPTVATSDIFESITYNPLNLGEAVGELRVLNGTESRPAAATDIVIYDRLPNDLPLVAGVITSAPQTPLSHVNLRAQQNGIPNAYLVNAASLPPLSDFIGKTVWMAVTPDRIEIREATPQEVRDTYDARRPAQVTYPPRNLKATDTVTLNDLPFSASDAFGGKATGVAELRRAIDPRYVPNGFAVPFSFYHTFMTVNGLYDQILSTMARRDFQDGEVRKDLLKAFRRTIKDAPVPNDIRGKLDVMHKAFPAGTTPRCRSSANAEDTIGFTGAGLYDSYTHRLDEGHIEKSIKQVWASLWNFRAFEEREFYRIDHLTAAMGVLVHPNYDDERVNGVAITRNLYFDNFPGYYVNAQVGEDLITNPTGDETAEELLIMEDLNGTPDRPYEMIYVRRSSLVGEGETVIQPDDLLLLTEQMRLIQAHFAKLYGRTDDPTFAMDIEFKVDRNGLLSIKQARPWVG
ncbi:Pyruvate phosphate dikinase, PEP/pyruvate binding domain [Cognatiyoonia koreensis]|uniref:Phosphoenolpyruvate synthase n=1 Tax=Cognatiyoonia koreensis TaxID=364200 RepID=A0A1I0QCZ2_9RHOB|nr:PEP/pyruvate-binding domain-containing protein [Cognatiyoonia koreensis]SEW24758.1 Pyruvate phosphate dikinase, PEP/pyruvate binding domain [Cognatiyoonia koreensis]